MPEERHPAWAQRCMTSTFAVPRVVEQIEISLLLQLLITASQVQVLTSAAAQGVGIRPNEQLWQRARAANKEQVCNRLAMEKLQWEVADIRHNRRIVLLASPEHPCHELHMTQVMELSMSIHLSGPLVKDPLELGSVSFCTELQNASK